MTETLIAPTATRGASPWVLELHGRDPETGHLATWHATPLTPESPGLCTLERVAGDINHPAVWMQATKESFVVTQDELFALVREISSQH